MDTNGKRPIDADDDGDDGCRVVKDSNEFLPVRKRPYSKSSKDALGIEDLCDDVILLIFKNLSHDDIAKMSLVCPALYRVSKYWMLWQKVRFDKFDRSMENIYLKYIQKNTSHMTITGTEIPTYYASVSDEFLIELKKRSPNLSHLTLSNQIFDAEKISVKLLPRKLKSLTIEHTVVYNIQENHDYLKGLHGTCPNLEEIQLLFNDWVIPKCLRALAKLKKLTLLSLKGCHQFKNSAVYVASSTVTGFQSLRTLDLQLTPIYDDELIWFQGLRNLKHLLLENPNYIDDNHQVTITDFGLSIFCDINYDFGAEFHQIVYKRNQMVLLIKVFDENPDNRCKLESVHVRNYPAVTDAFLKSLAKTCQSINLLDVTGTSCTLDEIRKYEAKRPDLKIVYETS